MCIRRGNVISPTFTATNDVKPGDIVSQILSMSIWMGYGCIVK